VALNTADWIWIVGFFVLWLAIGLCTSRNAGSNSEEFFLSGRNMPWWLLGISMVATTFSTDTPNLVTDIVRKNGVSGNWVWWAFLLTGMLTVFVYARLWRRSEVLTDLEFYEIRYGGKAAAFLRGFRAVYLGLFFNVMIMATVTLAAIKIGGVLLNLSPLQTILIASAVTATYSMLGGLRGVILADFIQFSVAMLGAFAAAWYALDHPAVGGLQGLLNNPVLSGKLGFLPDFNDWSTLVPVLLIPLAVQWWSVWYPGAEPGGGGYIAQRMLAAKDEKNAMGAALLFNAAHYGLRPWPWILVALCSILVFPDLEALQAAFPHVDKSVLGDDLAYPAMLTFLPHGLLGMVVASLIAAFMSTISTHLNWGSSYLVNDVYRRFFKPDATGAHLVKVGRFSTLILMLLAGLLALALSNALQAFQILLQIGAGTGLLFILRWFWRRINAASEIAAMVISFLVAVYFQWVHTAIGLEPLEGWQQLLIGVAVTTAGWVAVTFMTPPTDEAVLKMFEDRIRADKASIPRGILGMLLGCAAIYGLLFSTGFWIYGRTGPALVLSAVTVIAALALSRV